MQGIENSPQAARALQNNPSENSRRPGTAGHPGKHLGHSKAKGNAAPAGASRFEQQLNLDQADSNKKAAIAAQGGAKPEKSADFDTETTAEKVAKKGQAQRGNNAADQKVNDRTFDIQLDHLQDTGDAFAEQIAFTGKTHAISTGFF